MALELISTPGADDANAFADVETAQAYASYRVGGAAFLALTEDQQIQALVTATSDISTLEGDPGFINERNDDEQALPFPRNGEPDLPANLVNATIELAMSYAPAFSAGASIDVLNPGPDGGIKREKTGPLETEWFAPRTTEATAIERFPEMVQRLLASLLRSVSGAGWGSAVVTRGS